MTLADTCCDPEQHDVLNALCVHVNQCDLSADFIPDLLLSVEMKNISFVCDVLSAQLESPSVSCDPFLYALLTTRTQHFNTLAHLEP